METKIDDYSQMAQQYRYAMHREDSSNLSYDRPIPPKVLRRDGTFNDDEFWYLLPGLRAPTFDTLQSWSMRWFRESAWPGMGLFGESYLLFSTGTLKPIWASLFPECFEYATCSPRLLNSLTYSVVLGVIFGMVVIGYLANNIGRRQGSILTASLMSCSASGLFLATLIPSPVWLYRAMSVLFFIFGVGVGGEYPLSASSAAEKAMLGQLEDRIITEEHERVNAKNGSISSESLVGHSVNLVPRLRGRQVQLVFTMQGVGIWLNSTSLILLLLLTGQMGAGNYNPKALMAIWRIMYLFGAVILFLVLIIRFKYLEESIVWADDKQRREGIFDQKGDGANLDAHDSDPSKSSCVQPPNSSLGNLSFAVDTFDESQLDPSTTTYRDDCVEGSVFLLLMRHYGMRLFGASASWLLWDVAFYGNKLFQSNFLLALTGKETTLFEFALSATLNSTVALFGYFGAAFLVDHPNIGRRRLQAAGLFLTGLMFVATGFSFEKLSIFWQVVLYLGSTFFGQLGPNATTFLVPTECFPTEMRTVCHGLCAASGKVGALCAAIFFNYLKNDLDFFVVCGYACFLAALVTFWAVPETTGLDVLELDRKWRMMQKGNHSLYRGPANNPEFWSMYEKWQENRRHKVFDRADDCHGFS